jgi:hypothetical protein
MPVALKRLEDEVMKLSVRSRARLAVRLITSREEPPDPGAERPWIAEAETRAGELSSGKVKGVPAGKAFKRARAAPSLTVSFSSSGATRADRVRKIHDERAAGLGADFMRQIERTLGWVVANPGAGTILRGPLDASWFSAFRSRSCTSQKHKR